MSIHTRLPTWLLVFALSITIGTALSMAWNVVRHGQWRAERHAIVAIAVAQATAVACSRRRDEKARRM